MGYIFHHYHFLNLADFIVASFRCLAAGLLKVRPSVVWVMTRQAGPQHKFYPKLDPSEPKLTVRRPDRRARLKMP
jgi:hypothetical protein